MDQKILDFLTKEHIGSLTTTLPDNSLHAAAMHFSHANEPFELYFSTENTSRKCKGLLHGEVVNAAVVVGLSETEWITIQLDGVVQIVSDKSELEKIQTIHYSKHPNSAQYKDAPETVFLKFTPKWWRYTDYNTKPPTLISSED